ncbi:MAG: hypothetical protein ACI81T_004427 [Bacteroidia bacterium]
MNKPKAKIMTKFVLWVVLLILSISGVVVLGIAMTASRGGNEQLFIVGIAICVGASLFFGKKSHGISRWLAGKDYPKKY